MKGLFLFICLATLLCLSSCAPKVSPQIAPSGGAEIVSYDLEGADYALLHVYRSGGGALVSYNLYLGNDTLCRVKNNFAETVKVVKDGRNSLWAKTETKEEVPINIEFGKEYYIHCSIAMGFFVGRPRITIVDPVVGKKEFETILSKQKTKK